VTASASNETPIFDATLRETGCDVTVIVETNGRERRPSLFDDAGD
jgi:hypothetical protein